MSHWWGQDWEKTSDAMVSMTVEKMAADWVDQSAEKSGSSDSPSVTHSAEMTAES